eukprot:Skav212246  [mRNA]  locus=scaffold4106:219051:233236:- [translate_table: standard]
MPERKASHPNLHLLATSSHSVASDPGRPLKTPGQAACKLRSCRWLSWCPAMDARGCTLGLHCWNPVTAMCYDPWRQDNIPPWWQHDDLPWLNQKLQREHDDLLWLNQKLQRELSSYDVLFGDYVLKVQNLEAHLKVAQEKLDQKEVRESQT